MNKKSKEIVKKLCFTLVIVISIITIIGCQNGVSNNTGAGKIEGTPKPEWKPEDVLKEMEFTDKSPVVTEAKGLSFGRTPKGLCLYGGITFKDAKEEIPDIEWPDYPSDEYFYPNVREGLERRWIDTRDSYKSATKKWLEPCNCRVTEFNNFIRDAQNISGDKPKVQKTCDFQSLGYYFVIRRNTDIFACTPIAGQSYFADWHIVFVEKVENPKMYSFHYGPYILWNVSNEHSADKEPHVDVNYNEAVHMFTLSGMLRDFLSKKGEEKDLIDGVVERFSHDNIKDKYDVYLVFGKLFRGNDAPNEICGYDEVGCSFRNVFKLTACDYWKDCWEKDE